jgi:antitoxin Phd
MKSMAAKDAKQSFGELMDAAMREPVSITKNGKPSAVLLSQADYERLEAMEDLVWALRADEAVRNADFLGPDETARFIRQTLESAGS